MRRAVLQAKGAKGAKGANEVKVVSSSRPAAADSSRHDLMCAHLVCQWLQLACLLGCRHVLEHEVH